MPESHYGIVETAGPIKEPVTLADLKNVLKVDVSADDEYIVSLGIAAREYLEEYTRKRYVQATYLWTLDSFFGYMIPGGTVLLGHRPVPQQRGGGWYYPNYSPILLTPRSPLIRVNYLKYVEPQGSLVTLDPTQYQVDTISQPGRLLPVYGQVWPVTREVPNAVQVSFDAGTTAVPERAKQVIRILTNLWYENRVEANSARSQTLPMGLRMLLASLDSGVL